MAAIRLRENRFGEMTMTKNVLTRIAFGLAVTALFLRFSAGRSGNDTIGGSGGESAAGGR